MTMTYERSRANLQTRRCLRELTKSPLIQDVPLATRERARRVLRHHRGASQIVLEQDVCLADLTSPDWAILAEVLVKQREHSDWLGHDGTRRND